MAADLKDVRSLYFKPGSLPEDFPAWNKKVLRNMAIGTYLVKSGDGVLGGVIIIRGAADALALIYDRPNAIGVLSDDDLAAAAGITGAANAMSGFVNMPIAMYRGIVVNINQADMIVAIYFA